MVTRRTLVAAAPLLALGLPRTAAAAPVELTWEDLVPEGEEIDAQLDAVLDHDSDTAAAQAEGSGVRTDWNGETVRMPGFVVPLEHRGAGVVTFLLVPFVGACIHVPPPPPNQLVYVTTDAPYEIAGLYEPVEVTGRFRTATTQTELAQVGYRLTADTIAPYSE